MITIIMIKVEQNCSRLQDRTMVSLTLMLVIATISASIQQVSGDVQLFLERFISHPVSLQSLPATPYFKMIDIWLFFTMNLMVVSHLKRTISRKRLPQVLCLIFHTYLEYVIQTVEQREKRCQQHYLSPNFANFRIWIHWVLHMSTISLLASSSNMMQNLI